MKKFKLFLMAVAMFGTMAMYSCGGATEETPAEEPATETVEETPAPVEEAPVTDTTANVQ